MKVVSDWLQEVFDFALGRMIKHALLSADCAECSAHNPCIASVS